MLYTLNKIEKGAWPDGKPKLKATVTDVAGKTTENVTISKTKQDGTEFPNFDNLVEGMKIEAEEWVNPKGYMSLYPPRLKTPTGANRGTGGAMGDKMMKKKAEYIQDAQDNKELGIRLSSTARMATDMVIAISVTGKSSDNIKKDWQLWRKWFIDNWENIKADGLTSDGNNVPFNDTNVPY